MQQLCFIVIDKIGVGWNDLISSNNGYVSPQNSTYAKVKRLLHFTSQC